MKRILDTILAHPIIVLLMFAVATGLLGWQAKHFEIDASADTLLTPDNELYIETQVMNQRFSPEEFLLVAYEPKDGELFTPQTIENLQKLTRQLNELERVSSIRSILNVPLLLLMENGPLSGEPGEFTQEQQGYSLKQLRGALAEDPIYRGLIVNEALTATALQVLFEPHDELTALREEVTAIQKNALERDLTGEEQDRIDALHKEMEPLEKTLSQVRNEEIRTIRKLLPQYEDTANVYLGGAHVVGYQLIQIISSDLILFGSIIAIVICLILLLLFRRARWVLLPTLCCGCSVLLTVGLFGLLGLKTTVISSNFIALQLILTLAIVVHLIVQYRETCAAEIDWDQTQLVRATMLTKARPCFYAGLTTSVGFASLLFTNIQPVVSFGWMMIIAMFFSIITSLILFPAMMVLFKREASKNENTLSRAVLALFTRLCHRRSGWILAFSGAVFLFTAGGLLLLNVENSFINYFDESTEVYQELSFIDEELGGTTALDVVVTIPEAQQEQGDLVVTAQTVQRLQDIQGMLEEQEGMGKVLSIVNFTELARKVNDDKPLTEYELTAIYRSVSEDLRADLVGSFFSAESSQLRISARVQDATEGLNRAELIESIEAGVEAQGVAEENYALTNLFVLYQDILQRLFKSQILALGLVYLVLTLTFLVLFRSLRLALIGIAPNILSTVAVLGIMGWLRLPLDLMTITIASIAMGIAVDDTIHYIHRYRDEPGPTADAIKRTNFSVGYAVLYTSVIITLGFSQLGFSDFVPSVHFGLLASLAMIMALVWNLSLLPVLLQKFAAKPSTTST